MRMLGRDGKILWHDPLEPFTEVQAREFLQRKGIESEAVRSEIWRLPLTRRSELTTFKQPTDALMIRKAYAWSVLKWKGVLLTNLDSLPTAEEQLYGDRSCKS